MIYLDTSVALAALFDEDRRPPVELWRQSLVSSRLLEYELRVRCNARSIGSQADALLARVSLVEMAPAVLERTLKPFPTQVRTLDALHLATALYLKSHGQAIELASYDRRMIDAATALGLPLWAA